MPEKIEAEMKKKVEEIKENNIDVLTQWSEDEKVQYSLARQTYVEMAMDRLEGCPEDEEGKIIFGKRSIANLVLEKFGINACLWLFEDVYRPKASAEELCDIDINILTDYYPEYRDNESYYSNEFRDRMRNSYNKLFKVDISTIRSPLNFAALLGAKKP
jgi:hypothetical protein